jgi:hypothetical protein
LQSINYVEIRCYFRDRKITRSTKFKLITNPCVMEGKRFFVQHFAVYIPRIKAPKEIDVVERSGEMESVKLFDGR